MTDEEWLAIFFDRVCEGAKRIGISFSGKIEELPRLDFYLKEQSEFYDEYRRACREVMRHHQAPLPASMLAGIRRADGEV